MSMSIANDRESIAERRIGLLERSFGPEAVRGGECTLPGDDASLRLAARLHTTLELEQLIPMFCGEVQRLVPHDGARFHDASGEVGVELGASATHSCGYGLVVNGELLGHLSFTRRELFTPWETRCLEDILCALIYPLRNALCYRRAIQGSRRDPLTGVGNRVALEEALGREMEISRRQNLPLVLALIDVDGFKRLNDQYGHLVGDCVLQELVERFAGCVRKTDLLFRYGGDEFVALLNATDEDGAACVAERLRACVEVAPFQCGDRGIALTVSIGLACLADNEDGSSLFARADRALYEAKNRGRNGWNLQWCASANLTQ